MMAMTSDPKAAVPEWNFIASLNEPTTVAFPTTDLSRVKYQTLTAIAMIIWPSATIHSLDQ